MAGDDLVKGGTGSSSTDVFGTVAREPAKEEEPARAPTPPTPVISASSGGFTQLLRALNYDAVKEMPAAAPMESKAAASVANPVVGGPMTQLPRTVSGSAAEKDTVEKHGPPASSSQVTSFLPQSAPVVPAVASPPASAPQKGGSFTQLFKTLEAEPAREREPEKPAVPAASFTEMFEVPKSSPVPTPPAEPVPAPPGSFTQLFAGVDRNTAQAASAAPTVISAAASPVSSPGSFTQMFQELDAPAVDSTRHEDVPEAGSVPAAAPQTVRSIEIPVPVDPPGSFTQMFQALGAPAIQESRYAPPPIAEAPKQAPASAPGSFTQMFRALAEESPRAKEPEAGPGSFTQLFGSAAPASMPAVPPPPSSYERPFAASAPGREESGASQMFATHREPQATPVERGLAFSPLGASPADPKPPVSSSPSSGGLTQLLRTLDGPTSAPKPYTAPSYPPPVASAPQPGSFTGVYEELGTPVVPISAPGASVAAAEPLAAGPSEFTRLINASAMREMALRGGGEAATPAPAPGATPAATGSGGGGFAMPSGLPAMPHASFGAPSAPQASMAGPGGAHAAASAAGGGQASFSAPKLPAALSVKMPEVPKAAGAPAGIQKYVPLLLILVIFLLLAILVAVVVLMKK